VYRIWKEVVRKIRINGILAVNSGETGLNFTVEKTGVGFGFGTSYNAPVKKNFQKM
jgi:hypothetical protein